VNFFLGFTGEGRGSAFADKGVVIWFLEKHDDLMVCEIRRAAGTTGYDFEIAGASGPKTIHCDSPKDLIAKYLDEHTRLMRDGWRPRAGNVAGLE
jgi:hypothetical protein